MNPLAHSDGTDEGPEPSGEPLSEDRIFSLLSATRRREVLRHLKEASGELPLSAITQRVAVSEGIHPDEGAAAVKKVYVSLYQTHVPALDAAGVVEYDATEKAVRLTPRAAPLFRYLDVADGADSGGARGLISRFFGGDDADD
jgi:hypothetical protein